MEARILQKGKGYIWIGCIGLLLGAAYLGVALQLPFGQLERPGAAVFPVIVGILFILVSLAAVWEGLKMDRAERVDFPSGSDSKRLLSLAGLLVAYFVALPWLGHVIATAVFCVLLIRLLSDIGWPRILVYSSAFTAVLYLLFVTVFNVPLPRGILTF